MLQLTQKEYDKLINSCYYDENLRKYVEKIDFLVENLKERKEKIEKQLKYNNKDKIYFNPIFKEFEHILNNKKVYLYYTDYSVKSGYMSVNECIIGLQIVESETNKELFEIVKNLFDSNETVLIYHYEDSEEEQEYKRKQVPQNILLFNDKIFKMLDIANNNYEIIN
jgi:hypothetical protein